jgi:hypothetical protein
MKDPTRLIDLSSDHRVVTLLRAGAAEQPTDGALRRTLRAAAVGGGIAASSLAAAASPAPSAATGATLSASGGAVGSVASSGLGAGGSFAASAKVGVLTQAVNASLATKVGSAVGLIKWVGVGMVGAASVTYAPEAVDWGTAQLRNSPAAQLASPAPPKDERVRAAAVADATSVLPATELAAPDAPATPDAVVARDPALSPLNNSAREGNAPGANAGSGSVPARASDSFTREVRLVETSRNALRFGDPALSLSLLANYETQYPELQLRPEVLRLRLEALQQLGRSDAARTVAREILQHGATGAHAERARALLNQNASN